MRGFSIVNFGSGGLILEIRAGDGEPEAAGMATHMRCGRLSSKLSVSNQGRVQVAAVVTQPPSTRGRGRKLLPSAVEQHALHKGFPADRIFSPQKAGEETFLAELKKLKPDLCVTAAYGNILPTKFLNIAPCGTVNVHPSLLPLYRGAAPVQRAVQDGVKVSGVTVAYTVRALDAGPIIAAESHDVDSNIKAPELLRTLFQKGSELLLREMPFILNGTAREKAVDQDHEKATLAPKVAIEESWLSFDQPAEVLHNKVRAFAEWPGTRAKFLLSSSNGVVQTIELKIVTTRVKHLSHDTLPSGGEVSLLGDALVVPCGGEGSDGTCLEILQLQPPAKKVMSARDFCNGLRGQKLLKDINGTRLPSAHMAA
ncbi:hypothetical protein AXG93_3509s1050 [Marchantia polymorpha subsp. ruderalis]|uniref:methionyl-tRNA formyltransferase n=3 Tax=Marchantia polymorpha TaxID=3197 RepID=A0A176VRX3_MARPO|nr:hypothetical protein AXG93_3509s1050 [Marchantia polymorpha subsp. ruderalis]